MSEGIERQLEQAREIAYAIVVIHSRNEAERWGIRDWPAMVKAYHESIADWVTFVSPAGPWFRMVRGEVDES